MSPAALARLHAACFATPAPWSAEAFRALLDGPGVVLLARPEGFALIRVVVDEAELLTIAVAPEARRRGIARALLAEAEADAARAGARRMFLDVAADNAAARGLYAAAGYAEAGRRPGYYTAPGAARIDALLLRKALSAPPG